MNFNDVSTQLLYTTVPLQIKYSNGVGVGTGFLFGYTLPSDRNKSIPLLITNRHVVEGAELVTISFHSREEDKPIAGKPVSVNLKSSHFTFFHENVDLAAVPLMPLISEVENQGKKIFFKTFSQELIPSDEAWNDLSSIEEVTFIGYPAGLLDRSSSLPVVRRGITATPVWNNFEKAPLFLIDAGVFPGSSGSPVLIFNRGTYPVKTGIALGSRIYLLGIISETYKGLNKDEDKKVFLGLGKVINSKALLKGLEDIVGRVQVEEKNK